MNVEEKQKQLIAQLKSHYKNDINMIKRLSSGCRCLGLNLKDEEIIDAIADNPEHFFTLMTFSDFGILDKIKESLEKLKG